MPTLAEVLSCPLIVRLAEMQSNSKCLSYRLAGWLASAQRNKTLLLLAAGRDIQRSSGQRPRAQPLGFLYARKILKETKQKEEPPREFSKSPSMAKIKVLVVRDG